MALWVVQLSSGELVEESIAESKEEAVKKYLKAEGIQDGRSWKWWLERGGLKARKVNGTRRS